MARYLISIPFSTTAFLLAIIAFRMMNFHDQGLGMYPGLEIPKNYDLQWALDTFWYFSMRPLMVFFLITLPLDATIRRYGLHLNQT